MKIGKLNLCLFLILCFCTFVSQAQVNKKHLVTPTHFDKITKTTTYKDLLKLYGKNNVKDSFYLGDGDTTKVTFIYPETPKEIAIYWEYELFHEKINFIESSHPKAPYYTIYGLKMRSTLKKLLQINGKKVTFLGFGWDYGGYVSSFNNGKLQKTNISFGLDGPNKVMDVIVGDKEFNTSMPLVKKNLDQLFIGRIGLSFEKR